MPKLALAFDILAKDAASKALLDIGDAADTTGGKLSNLGGVGKVAFGALAGAGGLAAAGLIKGFGDALGQGVSSARLAASLGLTAEESAAYGKAAGDIYADAYGESFDQVNDALGAVHSNFTDLVGDDLEATTKKAQDLASVFQIDVSEAARRAGILVKTGLAKNADEAFDLVVKSMQRMTPELRDELGDATTEYSRFFADIGISGSEMLGLFAQADDVFELDKTGDAIKEFTIRATDMSKLTENTFYSMGMDAKEMAARLLEGGETARGAFEEIITGLYSIEDPVERANSAIALFGTPLEDLGVNEIPTFLAKLGEMETGLGNVKGAADLMGDTLNDNASTKLETFKRGMTQNLVEFLGTEIIPAIEEIGDAWGEDGFGGALDLLIDEKLPQWLDALGVWAKEEGVPAALDAGKKLGIAMADGYVDGMKSLLGGGPIWNDFAQAVGFPGASEAQENPLDPTGTAKADGAAAVDRVLDLTDWVRGQPIFKTKGLAEGTDWWGGGTTWVGEDGPELLDLPRGSRVTPNRESMAMAAGFDAVGEDQLMTLREQNGLLRDIRRALTSRGPDLAGSRASAAVMG